MKISDWNEIKQNIINDIVDIKKQTMQSASVKIQQMLEEEGVRVSVSNNKIFFEAKTQDELDIGRNAFQKVLDDINNHRDWLGTL